MQPCYICDLAEWFHCYYFRWWMVIRTLFFFLAVLELYLVLPAMLVILLLLVCFSNKVSHFCLGWPQTEILLPLLPKYLGLQACTTTPDQ
jgi:hypothetical protein